MAVISLPYVDTVLPMFIYIIIFVANFLSENGLWFFDPLIYFLKLLLHRL